MKLVLELTPEQEKRLGREAAALGIDMQALAIQRLFGPTLADLPHASGALGAIEGAPRTDGRNRSEIEAAAD